MLDYKVGLKKIINLSSTIFFASCSSYSLIIIYIIKHKLNQGVETVTSPSNSVIIINDNADLLNLFKDALEQQEIDTYTFTDPSLALKKIKADPEEFSLVIINYSSQLKNQQKGFGKFATEVKAINKNIKVMLTSGFNFNTVDIMNEGYDKFLQLPVKLSVLVSTVKEMLNLSDC